MKINEQKTGKDKLRNAIRAALAGSILVSGMANAVLRDHGPINQTGFPDWYRDGNGLAIGQCIAGDEGPNGPLCLTGPADALPPGEGFVGNIGDEAFYNTADIEIPITGGSFQWIGHLEMAYGSALGSPPAIRDPLNPTEIVFSRERIRFDIPAGDGSCTGKYTIRTPYKEHNFDLVEGDRALFYTDDIQPIMGDYAAVLKGHIGPFFTWDVAENGLPVSKDNPVVRITPPVGRARNYVGDPNVPHTFLGSTLPAGPGHEDKNFNNYVEIIPPAACNLGAGPGGAVFSDEAAVSGVIWDLPIADPTSISKATYTRDVNNTIVGLDVWATAPKNQNLVLTAIDSNSQNLPSVKMDEEIKGDGTGFYHAHLEFSPNAGGIPGQVSVANMSSDPVARDAAAVLDEVVITKSTFNSDTRVLCIAGHSGDEYSLEAPDLHLEAPIFGPLGNFVAPTASCPGAVSNDKVLEVDLDNLAPDFRIPPEGILVESSLGGREVSQASIIRSGAVDQLNIRAVDDVFTGVPGINTKAIDLVSDVYTEAAPGTVVKTAGLDNAPTNPYRIVVVSQPEIGTVTAAASGGTVTYEAVSGMPTSTQTFYYAIQDTADNSVSNVAKVEMGVVEVIPPPVGVADRQGVFRTGAGVIRVLANDVTGLTTTAIDPTSILFANGLATSSVLRGAAVVGTVVANADGTVTYTPTGQSGAANNTIDTFTYTVANVSGARSEPVTVQVVLKQAAEAVAFQRVRFNGGWNIRFTSSYAGAAGAVTLAPTASCALTANPGAPANVGPIGSASPVAGANNYVVGGATPVPSGNNWTVRCTTSSGGFSNRTGTL